MKKQVGRNAVSTSNDNAEQEDEKRIITPKERWGLKNTAHYATNK